MQVSISSSETLRALQFCGDNSTQGDANHSTVWDASRIWCEKCCQWIMEQRTTNDPRQAWKICQILRSDYSERKVYTPTFSDKVVVYGVIHEENWENRKSCKHSKWIGLWLLRRGLELFAGFQPGCAGQIGPYWLFKFLTTLSRTICHEVHGFIDIPSDGYYTFYSPPMMEVNFILAIWISINNDGLQSCFGSFRQDWIESRQAYFTISFFEKPVSRC